MKIQLLIGMIASAKSHYAKNAAKQGLIIVNDDDIVTSLHGGDYTLYDKKLKVLYKSIENTIVSFALSIGKSVIIDRGVNISLQGRKRWIALAKSFDVLCEAIVFEKQSPETHAQRRFNHDPRGLSYQFWLNCAKEHNNKYISPSQEEGFNVIHYVTFEEIKSGKVYI